MVSSFHSPVLVHSDWPRVWLTVDWSTQCTFATYQFWVERPFRHLWAKASLYFWSQGCRSGYSCETLRPESVWSAKDIHANMRGDLFTRAPQLWEERIDAMTVDYTGRPGSTGRPCQTGICNEDLCPLDKEPQNTISTLNGKFLCIRALPSPLRAWYIEWHGAQLSLD